MLSNPYVPITDLPTGLKGQSFSRLNPTVIVTLTSGRLALVAVPLRAGAAVTTLSFASSTTALSGGTNAWAALYDPSLTLLAQSVNDAAPTWAANSRKDFTLASPVSIPSDGLYLAGVMIAGTTPPTLVGIAPSNGGDAVAALSPVVGGNFNTGLTTTAPGTASSRVAASLPWVGWA